MSQYSFSYLDIITSSLLHLCHHYVVKKHECFATAAMHFSHETCACLVQISACFSEALQDCITEGIRIILLLFIWKRTKVPTCEHSNYTNSNSFSITCLLVYLLLFSCIFYFQNCGIHGNFITMSRCKYQQTYMHSKWENLVWDKVAKYDLHDYGRNQ